MRIKEIKSNFNWKKIRAKWEVGYNAQEISEGKNMPSKQAINKRVRSEKWTRDLEAQIQLKVSERVAGLVSDGNFMESEEAISDESLRRSSVELRHRVEPRRITALLNSSLRIISTSTATYSSEKDPDKKRTILFDRKMANEDLKSLKIIAEILEKTQAMERKSFRLDTQADESGKDSDLVTRITAARRRAKVTINVQ